MKKVIIILGIACISASAIAQPAVRIGNMEIIVRKQDQDTTMQVNILDEPCPTCPSEGETQSKSKSNTYKYYKSSGFVGLGFILPDNGNNYYTVLGGSSINLDIGNINRYQLTRRFALIGTVNYSYYNYKLRDANSETKFKHLVLDDRDFDRGDIDKQVFRSHNLATGLFTRFYLIPPKNRGKDGLYIDVGAQGDFAFSKYYKIKTLEGKKKYRDQYAFNPFSASAVARVGWKWNRNWFGNNDSRAIFVRYRFTNAFNSKELPVDLPPITIGVHFF